MATEDERRGGAESRRVYRSANRCMVRVEVGTDHHFGGIGPRQHLVLPFRLC